MGDKPLKQFPSLATKLNAPTKKSVFERQREEAEAKRARDAAETKAAYEEFVKSFAGDDDDREYHSTPRRRPAFTPMAIAGTKRHFTPGQRKTLTGSGPGSLGYPSFSKKRAADGSSIARNDRDRSMFGRDEDHTPGKSAVSRVALDDDDDADLVDDRSEASEKAAARPTLRLSGLPPGMAGHAIKALLPDALRIDRVQPQLSGTSAGLDTDKKSGVAIVTLAKDTPASDIDAAVSALQGKYLGWGYYLTLGKHLSSAALAPGMPDMSNMLSTALPFGAKPIAHSSAFNRIPPGGLKASFAPPESLGGRTAVSSHAPSQVVVTPPADLQQIKMIHKTVEAVIKHGPEFEALLMSRPDVQRQERWAWIWDARSPGGVWYRWRLWTIMTGIDQEHRGGSGGLNAVFDGGAPWMAPNSSLRFEFSTSFEEFVGDPLDYDSSEEENSDEEEVARQHAKREGHDGDSYEESYLNPLQKAKLTYLLARLPTSTGRLRKGDVARVTAFAISHASAGKEVADLIVANIERPLAYCKANHDPNNEADHDGEQFKLDRPEPMEDAENRETKDDTSSKLIALYVVSDILQSSSVSGVRHAWKYRQLFEAALTQRRIFEKLGEMEKVLGWGRLKAEKWKRSVMNLLNLWEGWSVFSTDAQEMFVRAFNHEANADKPSEEAPGKLLAKADRSRWKAVHATEGTPREEENPESQPQENVDDEAMHDDLDGEAMEEDLDGEAMEEDLDGEAMEELDSDQMNEANDERPPETSPAHAESKGLSAASSAPDDGTIHTRRSRPRAVDMFADSDSDK